LLLGLSRTYCATMTLSHTLCALWFQPAEKEVIFLYREVKCSQSLMSTGYSFFWLYK
jgi:hypothetical protein